MYFSNYKRLVYLAQTENSMLLQMAKDAAARLDLKFEYRLVGYGQLQSGLNRFHSHCYGNTSSDEASEIPPRENIVQWRN